MAKKRPASFKKKTSMWRDPVVRILAGVIAIIIVGGLMTFIMMLVNGLAPTTPIPQTSGEAATEMYRNLVEMNQDPDDWSKLIVNLANQGRMTEARKQLVALQATDPDVTQNQAVAYAEAYLHLMDKNYEEAQKLLEKVRTDLMDAYETELATDKDKNWAQAGGIPDNYFRATLALIQVYLHEGKDSEALALFDEYLTHNPTEAGLLFERAQLKRKMGDTAGALEDLTQAQKFLPEDEEIAKELKEVEALQ